MPQRHDVLHQQFLDWRESGHAEIFTQNIDNPAGHWSTGCASCHTLGADGVANDGFDEKMAAEGWTVPHGHEGNYEAMFASAPETAKRANIQCESCHGPNGSAAHMTGEGRVDYGSDVCSVCHGEPPRHARFQQWQESGHGSYELAIDESGSGSCARCHTGQGFVEWQRQGFGEASIDVAAIGLTADNAHPQTCVACHDPHKQGTLSGEPNSATVRVYDYQSLLAGFEVDNVGHGALCMTCHNSRRGLRNDFEPNPGAGEYARSPHGPTQADILMGQNAYFVLPGQPSPHAFIDNSCTNCHMVKTPPPAELSYNQSGTNHTFAASDAICSTCHAGFQSAASLTATVEDGMAALHDKMASAVQARINGVGILYVAAGDVDDPVTGASSTADLMVDTVVNPIAAVAITSGHGRQEVVLTFTAAVLVAGLGNVDVVMARVDHLEDGAGARLFDENGNLWKAIWNYLMLSNDGSHGVHHPDFVFDVLTSTLQQDLSN